MPYANNAGVRIHYESVGGGPPLVLQHGFTSNLKTWYDGGYVDALQDDCQLILIDARGHGASDKPHDPRDYTLDHRASDVLAVVDHLGLRYAHYMGYSMGGRIGWAIANYCPDRFSALIIGGAHPFKNDPQGYHQRWVELLGQGMPAWVANMERSGPLPPRRKADLLANDSRALLAAAIATRDVPGFEAGLPALKLPCLVYSGDNDERHDQAKAGAALVPGATWVSLPGLDHGQTMQRSDVVLPHVRAFLARVAHAAGAAPRR